MTPEAWQTIKQLFQEALEQKPEKRAAFLDEACRDHPEARAIIDEMLAGESASDDFLESSGEDFFPILTGIDTAGDALAGNQVGAFRLERLLGEGGMGSVYLGVREDSEFRQQVAIKLIKRGMDTRAVLQRFQAERQTLASLSHPNIARLYDGGSTADGLPYLVMEYIEGIPIHDYCDQNRLTLRQRLQAVPQGLPGSRLCAPEPDCPPGH